MLETLVSIDSLTTDHIRRTSNNAEAVSAKLLDGCAGHLREEQDVPVFEAHDERIKVIRYRCFEACRKAGSTRESIR